MAVSRCTRNSYQLLDTSPADGRHGENAQPIHPPHRGGTAARQAETATPAVRGCPTICCILCRSGTPEPGGSPTVVSGDGQYPAPGNLLHFCLWVGGSKIFSLLSRCQKTPVT